MPFLASLQPEDAGRLQARVAGELTTTFASSYSDEISLDQALDLDVMRRYAQQATGQKYLVRPQALRVGRDGLDGRSLRIAARPPGAPPLDRAARAALHLCFWRHVPTLVGSRGSQTV